MLQIRTTATKLGPYATVETLADRYRVNGRAEIPFVALDSPGVVEPYDGFQPPAPPVVPPLEVTMRQGRLALLAAGKLALVEQAIAALPSPAKEAAQIEWEYSSSILRYGPLVQSLAPAIGLSDADVDALFIAANAL